MPNYKKTQSQLELIEKIDYSTTGTTKTFTFPAIDFVQYSELILILSGGTTAALALLLQINGSGNAKYHTDGTQFVGGTETLINIDTATSGTICSAALLAGANENFYCRLRISLSLAGSSDRPQAIVESSAGGSIGQERVGIVLTESHTDISSLTVLVSTSSWQAGTKFTLYKLAR